MTIECYNSKCSKHSCNDKGSYDDGPFCHEEVCSFEPKQPTRLVDAIAVKVVEQRNVLNLAYDALRTCTITGTATSMYSLITAI